MKWFGEYHMLWLRQSYRIAAAIVRRLERKYPFLDIE